MDEKMNSVSTKECIRAAALELLKTSEYHDLQMKQIAETAHIGRRTIYRYFKSKHDVMTYIVERLMNDFAEKLLQDKSQTLEEIGITYFKFWEEHIDTLLLLKKAHLLYFVEDALPQLILQVAMKTKYQNKTLEEVKQSSSEDVRYEFGFKLAGFWKLTQIWSEEVPRKTPEEMSKIIAGFIKGGKK